MNNAQIERYGNGYEVVYRSMALYTDISSGALIACNLVSRLPFATLERLHRARARLSRAFNSNGTSRCGASKIDQYNRLREHINLWTLQAVTGRWPAPILIDPDGPGKV